MKIKLLTALLITSTLLPTISMAKGTEAPSCDQVLNACDKALQDQIQLGTSKDILIKDQNSLILSQHDKIDMLEKDNSSLLKNPYLWFGVGLVTGVVLVNKTK
jgi:hypothetical protein